MATSSSSGSALMLSDSDTAAIQSCLAEQIGPAARVVLMRALSTWEPSGKSTTAAYADLLNSLAAFIDDEEKRQVFITRALNISLGQ